MGLSVERRTREESLAWFRDHVSSGKAAFFAQYGMEFMPGRREGIYLWDTAPTGNPAGSGTKRIINCHCNGGVFNLGHRHPVIIETLRQNTHQIREIIKLAVTGIPDRRDCACATALEAAIVTDPRFIPAEQKQKLDLLIGKYLT